MIACTLSESVYSPFKGMYGSHLHVGISTDFYSQILWGLFFPELEPWVGEISVGLGPLAPLGNLRSLDVSPKAQPPHMGAGRARFTSPPLLPVSMWPLVYILLQELCSASLQVVLQVSVL